MAKVPNLSPSNRGKGLKGAFTETPEHQATSGADHQAIDLRSGICLSNLEINYGQSAQPVAGSATRIDRCWQVGQGRPRGAAWQTAAIASPTAQSPLSLLHLRRGCQRVAPAFFASGYERAVA